MEPLRKQTLEKMSRENGPSEYNCGVQEAIMILA